MIKMRPLLLVLVPLGLLSGCGKYSLDYLKPGASFIAPQLARYGLDSNEAQCVGKRLQASLDIWQLRQLDHKAGAVTRGHDGALSAQDLVWVSLTAKNPEVPVEVARAINDCGLGQAAASAKTEATASPPPEAVLPAPSAHAATDPEETTVPDTSGDAPYTNGPADYQPSTELLAALESYDSKDFTNAARLAKIAAGKGDSGAQQFLGGLYSFGQGVSADPKEAARLYAMAAEQGWAEAMNNLGRAYETGQGVAADPVEALKWYLLASRRSAEDDKVAEGNIQNLVGPMSTDDIQKGATLARQWEESHGRPRSAPPNSP